MGNADPMTLQGLTDVVRRRAERNPKLDAKVKFDLGADGIVFWDGTRHPPVVTNCDGDADTVLFMSAQNLGRLVEGTLDPTVAFMTGKLKVKGDLSIAIKLGAMLEE